jgi:hypothetical protein
VTGNTESVIRTFDYTPRNGVPRPAWTYRAARRNVAKGTVWKGSPVNYYGKPPVRENKRDRSKDNLI